ncbi:MAG: hypothetical protein HQL35_09470 [Alphaproteobacteria bacterium]|nr:hypothetical protein [Alphaproteobacteria bacterium]
MARTSWGKAKHQVYALKSEIIALLGQGESLASAHAKLVDKGQLKIGLSTFQRHAAEIRDAVLSTFPHLTVVPPQPPSEAPKSVSSPETVRTPSPIPTPDKKARPAFGHKSFVTPEELDALVYGEPKTEGEGE